MKYFSLTLFLFLQLAIGQGQTKSAPDSLDNDPIVAMLDSLVSLNFLSKVNFSEQRNDCNLPHECKQFSDYEYKTKLKKLNSPIPLDYNEYVRNYIELYANRRPVLTSRVLGLSQLYFPMFEQVFDQQQLPLEFKYLAIVESALNPIAVSPAGATGIWQFMYQTGKMYDLKVNSMIDERRDPYKATQAACKYFKDMYEIYQDWLLVIAAYNCGARNVNKAILRSGGKTNFWQIKKYLPKETQGYVPAFIAVSYVMNYYADYNITVTPPAITFFETDTIAITQHVSFESISSALNIPLQQLHYLNPVYKGNFIPVNEDSKFLTLPSNKVSAFITNSDKIYGMADSEAEKSGLKYQYTTVEKKKTYVVRKGETLTTVARKNDCMATDIKQWNKLKKNAVYPGQKLTIYVTEVQKTLVASTIPSPNDSINPAAPDTTSTIAIAVISEPKMALYEVQKNDTLYSISRKYPKMTIEQLKDLNKEVLGGNPNILRPGSKLKVIAGS